VTDEMPPPEEIELPIEGELDLHTFRPNEAASVVDEYLRVCVEKGLYEVRIIHGKGKGALLSTVHALLRKHPFVMDFGLDTGPSGWGATVVLLKKDTGDRIRETE
jgi:DNA-nicking Smr family endonuclease